MNNLDKYEKDLLIAHSIFGAALFDVDTQMPDEVIVVALLNLTKEILKESADLARFELIESELFDVRNEFALCAGRRRLI